MSLEARHALVVGGTGMLAGVARALSDAGTETTALARHASDFVRRQGRPNLHPCDANWSDADETRAALAQAIRSRGLVDLAIVWTHSLRPARDIAVALSGGTCRFFHVVGSAVADPSAPDRVAKCRDVAKGLGRLAYRSIVLGFVVEGPGSRWLTHDEIASGVSAAVAADAAHSVIGATDPWSLRPA